MTNTDKSKPLTRMERLALLRAALIGVLSGVVRAVIEYLLG